MGRGAVLLQQSRLKKLSPKKRHLKQILAKNIIVIKKKKKTPETL